MTHTYSIAGMTCEQCEMTVKTRLQAHPDITSALVSKDKQTAVVTMSKHVSIDELQRALGGDTSKYIITATGHNEHAEQAKSWLSTYKPILLIFSYITVVTLLIQAGNPHIDGMEWMRHFMAGFFLVFSFFKLLNLRGFAESYVMYDVLARRIAIWPYIYAFTELALGIAFIMNWSPLLTSIITLVVMSISIIGVLQSVLNKRKIQCACLGDVFNLPMSSVTIIEDGMMIGMSVVMIVLMAF